MVRCARCHHVWHQEPPADAPAVDLLPPVPAAVPRPPERIQLPALRQPPRREEPVVSWLLAALVLVVGLGVGAVWARDSILNLWPAAGRLYALVGLPTAAPGDGLDLSIENTARASENGIPELVVDGVLVNRSSIARPVPKLKLILRDGNQRVLQSRVFSVKEERLPPGAQVPFHAVVEDPPAAATEVAVTIVAGG